MRQQQKRRAKREEKRKELQTASREDSLLDDATDVETYNCTVKGEGIPMSPVLDRKGNGREDHEWLKDTYKAMDDILSMHELNRGIQQVEMMLGCEDDVVNAESQVTIQRDATVLDRREGVRTELSHFQQNFLFSTITEILKAHPRMAGLR